MFDGKLVATVQGDGGAFCHYCSVTQKEANDPTVIAQGFVIDKTVEEMRERWELVESSTIAYENPLRAGQTAEPVNKHPLQLHGILHKKLNFLNTELKVLYHIIAKHFNWSERGNEVKEKIKQAKKIAQDHIKVLISLFSH